MPGASFDLANSLDQLLIVALPFLILISAMMLGNDYSQRTNQHWLMRTSRTSSLLAKFSLLTLVIFLLQWTTLLVGGTHGLVFQELHLQRLQHRQCQLAGGFFRYALHDSGHIALCRVHVVDHRGHAFQLCGHRHRLGLYSVYRVPDDRYFSWRGLVKMDDAESVLQRHLSVELNWQQNCGCSSELSSLRPPRLLQQPFTH